MAFVAHPEYAPPDPGVVWAHPDSPSEEPGSSWREVLERNDRAGNPLGLWPAWKVYHPPEYRQLVETFGAERTFVLSAGWGLIRSSFPLPPYDITFVRSAAPHKRRSKTDIFADVAQLPASLTEPVVFLGGKDYLPPFSLLTRRIAAAKVVPFRCAAGDSAAVVRRDRDIIWVPFRTARRTNWHYGCAALVCSNPSWLRSAISDAAAGRL